MNELKNELMNVNPLSEAEGGVRTAMIPDEKLAELFVDTDGSTDRAEHFVEELIQDGRMLTHEAADKMAEGYREAARNTLPGQTLMVDSMGSLISHEQAAQIVQDGRFIPPAKTLKQKRAEKAAKKRQAKYMRSQYRREMGML
jgi:hypothetical protein